MNKLSQSQGDIDKNTLHVGKIKSVQEDQTYIHAKSKEIIKISKSQWEFIGKKAGWLKKAKLDDPNVCPGCEWYIEDEEPHIKIQEQKWHHNCWEQEQREQEAQAQQDRDYNPQA